MSHRINEQLVYDPSKGLASTAADAKVWRPVIFQRRRIFSAAADKSLHWTAPDMLVSPCRHKEAHANGDSEDQSTRTEISSTRFILAAPPVPGSNDEKHVREVVSNHEPEIVPNREASVEPTSATSSRRSSLQELLNGLGSPATSSRSAVPRKARPPALEEYAWELLEEENAHSIEIGSCDAGLGNAEVPGSVPMESCKTINGAGKPRASVAAERLEALALSPQQKEGPAGSPGGTKLATSPAAGSMHPDLSSPDGRKEVLLRAFTNRSFINTKKSIGIVDWRRDRESVDEARIRWEWITAICGLCGAIAACLQHELVVRGWQPQSLPVNLFKIMNTILTILLACFIYRLYYLNELFERIRVHLRLLVPLDVSVGPSHVLSQGLFWLELTVNIIHLPPFMTFKMGFLNWDNFILYRGETLLAMWNTLRLYHFWMCFVSVEVSRLPKRHTVSSFTGVKFDSAFTFKQVLNGHHAIPFIATFWICFVILLGYWFRAAELTACQFGYVKDGVEYLVESDPRCDQPNARIWTVWQLKGPFEKVNDTYLWNAMWAIYSITTTVGYGDVIPTTHTGRFVSALGNVLGLTMVAMLTSSFMFKLQFKANEVSANMMIEREKASIDLQEVAVRYLQNWFRHRRQGLMSTSVRVHNAVEDIVHGGREAYISHQLHVMKQAFRVTKEKSSVDFREMLADGVKIDELALRTKTLCEAVEVVMRRTDPSFGSNRANKFQELTEWEKGSMRLAKEVMRKSQTHIGDADIAKSQDSAGKSKGGKKLTAVFQMILLQKRQEKKSKIEEIPDLDETPKDPSTNLWLAVKEAAAVSQNPNRLWRRNRESVERFLIHKNFYAALFGVLACVASVIQNELIVRNMDPLTIQMNICKGFTSIFSVASIYFIYKIYWTNILNKRLDKFLRRGVPLDDDIGWSDVFRSKLFWIEVVICLLHCPPFVTAEISQEAMSNIIVYRLETIMCAVGLVRLYLVWRTFADKMLDDLPHKKKNNIASFTNVNFDSTFVLKRMLNSWRAGYWIAGFWITLVVLAGYLFRLAEHTHACLFEYSTHADCSKPNARIWTILGQKFEKENDLYVLNSAWFIFTSIQPGAGGNVAVTTHFGRLVGATAVLAGVVIGSLTTAALGNLMMFNPAETTARAMIDRERFRLDLQIEAVNIISLWWRRRRNQSKITKRQHKMDIHGFRREFVAAQKMVQVEVEDCASTSTKIDAVAVLVQNITKRTRYMATCMEQVGINLFHEKLSPRRKSPKTLKRLSAKRTGSDPLSPCLSRTHSTQSQESGESGELGDSGRN